MNYVYSSICPLTVYQVKSEVIDRFFPAFLCSFKIINTFFRRIDISMSHESVYASNLTPDSPIYMKGCTGLKYYYKSIPMRVLKTGRYDFVINSTIGIYAKIHKDYFHSIVPDVNLLLQSYGECVVRQTKFTINLWSDEIYYLIVDRTFSNSTSSFSVVSNGPSNIDFNPTREYYVFLSEATVYFRYIIVKTKLLVIKELPVKQTNVLLSCTLLLEL